MALAGKGNRAAGGRIGASNDIGDHGVTLHVQPRSPVAHDLDSLDLTGGDASDQVTQIFALGGRTTAVDQDIALGARQAAHGIAFVLVLLILTFVDVVFGELMPKSVAIRRSLAHASVRPRASLSPPTAITLSAAPGVA